MTTRTEHPNLLKGQTVTYDGRAQGVKTGTITKREIIKSYYEGGDNLIYYKINTNALLVPASDIIHVGAES